MKHIPTFEQFVNEATLHTISGNSGRTITVLDHKKYELTKDVKNAKVGDYSNVILPQGTIITNLPGGIFANHTSLKQQRNFKWDNTFGVRITSMPETIQEIEKNGKVLESIEIDESAVNENFPGVGETVDAKDINSDMKSYFNRTNRKLEITTKDNKKSNGSVNKFYNDLIFATKEKWDIPVKDILKVKILE